ncbi:hypothetical protein E4U15_001339 [Claviceps sp. LM218 group G6]|nr:hypothetical protein E4U15_001339 [Claviceps sp. LM218 group G6]
MYLFGRWRLAEILSSGRTGPRHDWREENRVNAAMILANAHGGHESVSPVDRAEASEFEHRVELLKTSEIIDAETS